MPSTPFGPTTAPHPSITVVVERFDDLLATGLHGVIESDAGITIVASDVEHSRIPVVLGAHRPDVAILDASALIKLAEVRELSRVRPATRLVLLADDLSTEECSQLLAFGASSCVGKDAASGDVLNAIHLASRGLRVMPWGPSNSGAGSVPGGDLLTRREAEVLPMLQQGRSNAQIALALQVGVETVRTHARNVHRKLGVSSRRELVAPPAHDRRREPVLATRTPQRRPATLSARPRRGDASHH
jgi:DNA-binding NarL/FixJ family response regulator